MSKITDYTAVTALKTDNVFLLDGPDGTKKMTANNLLNALMDISTPGIRHRMFYGGRNLGASVTSAQKTAIQNGTFNGILMGDYWRINNITWRIVDMDYFLYSGDTNATKLNKHHLVIMPDTTLDVASMNTGNTTANGYAGSNMRTTILPRLTAPANAFPTMILTHREYLCNAVTGGAASAYAYYDCTLEIPDENMMYGSSNIQNNAERASTNGQFALFILSPTNIHNDPSTMFWLRDVASATQFSYVTNLGLKGKTNASTGAGVRPYFIIG